MPKTQKKRHGAYSTPYSKPPTSSASTNNVFKMNTDLGQHVLKNPGVASAIVEKANLKPSDTVLEIGPGTGNLTVLILAKAAHCTAIEMDPRMAAEVTKRVMGTPLQKKLDVLVGDAVKAPFPHFDVCISNTPYQISSPLTFKLLATQPAPRCCVLMFQREFAMRLFARPGDKLYSRLSVNAQMWANITHVMKVGRNNFKPPPAVESNVVRIVPKVPRPQISYEEWDGLLRVCFVRKNKTLRASFLGTSSVLDMLEGNWKTWCSQNGIAVEDGPMEDGVLDEMEVEVDGGDDGENADEWDGNMDVDEDVDLPDFFKEERDRNAKKTPTQNPRKRRGKAAMAVRQKVRKVLEDATELADKRARMCDEGDFLKLLYEFNKEGIHFA
jgi:18S rRNA (adenine1779-N6/adenine1780-N6)-dimethyltransferase